MVAFDVVSVRTAHGRLAYWSYGVYPNVVCRHKLFLNARMKLRAWLLTLVPVADLYIELTLLRQIRFDLVFSLPILNYGGQ